MGDGLLSLNWNNHGATFCHTLASLRGKDKYTDVTVSCEGNFYQVHKLVLSTCSEYFEKIFENTPCKHPVIVLRDVQCDELESLLNYMYKGVVSVAQSDLSRLIKVAELLQIKGLAVPDEPPTSNRSGSNKRLNEDRLSPRTSAETDSPYPKRRRRRESDNYQPSTSGSSFARSKNSESHEPSWSEDKDNRLLDDRLHDPSQERVRSPVTVNVDEPLIKEEILDDDDNHHEDEVPDSDFGGLGDHSGDGSQDPGGLMIPKFDDKTLEEGDPSAVTLPDPVVEALAGPSGLQGWADGGDMTRRMALRESFGSGDSQDMSSSVGLPPQPSGQQPQQMVEQLSRRLGELVTDMGTIKMYHCPHCDFSTQYKGYLKTHANIHTGYKPYACEHCPSRFSDKTTLRNHIRKHTGERPYKCTFCGFAAIQRTILNRHIQRHHVRPVKKGKDPGI